MLAMIGPDGFLRRDRHPLDGAPLAQWPEAERPRERLLRHGAEALSSAELLAILLRTGTRGQSAVGLALQLLNRSNRSLLTQIGRASCRERV